MPRKKARDPQLDAIALVSGIAAIRDAAIAGKTSGNLDPVLVAPILERTLLSIADRIGVRVAVDRLLDESLGDA